MFKHITVKKKLSVFIVILLVVSFATGTYFNYDRGYAHGYIQGMAEAGGTPTISPDGISDMPWVNATAANFEEFYLNDALISEDLFNYPEQVASYIIFKEGSTTYAKNGKTGSIDYSSSSSNTVIQNSIDALVEGGLIFLRTGEYSDLSLVIGGNDFNIIISGGGFGTKLKGTNIYNAAIRMLNTRNITIRNLWMDDVREGIHCENVSNILFENLKFRSSTYFSLDALYIQEGTNVLITNCIIEGSVGRYGIHIWQNKALARDRWNDQIYIDKNKVFNATEYGISVVAGLRIHVTENTVKYNTQSGIVFTDSVYESIITGNDVGENGQCGIYLHEPCSEVSVIYNMVYHNNWTGINLWGADNCTIIGNIVVENDYNNYDSYSGIALSSNSDYNIISNNIVGNNDNYEIFIVHNTCDENLIIGNNLHGEDRTGIISDGGTDTRILNNLGYVTENIGTATILNGNIEVTVTHGLDYTPEAGDIQVHPIETMGSSSFWWVDTITSTTFKIKVDVNPTQDVDFAWSIDRH